MALSRHDLLRLLETLRSADGPELVRGVAERLLQELIETEAFWAQFLRHLRERGLTGARLVISDTHTGLVKAIRKVTPGAAWQRCRVHFVRNVLAAIPKGSAEMAAATIRTVFAQPTADAVRTQLDTVADMPGRQFPKVREMLLEAKDDLTTFADFPHQHWKKI